MKRKHLSSRKARLSFQQLESRNMMTEVITPAGVAVFYTAVNTSEWGDAVAIAVDLRRAPTAPVTITVASTNAAEGTVSTASLTFTTTNWMNAQSIIVTGVDDLVDDGNIVYSVAFGMCASTDNTYNNTGVAPVILLNKDDDLKANGAVGFSLNEDQGGVINNTVNDTDKSGNGTWGHNVIWAVGAASGQIEAGVQNLRNAWVKPDPDWYGDFVVDYSIRNEYGKVSMNTAKGKIVNVPDKPVANADEGITVDENSIGNVIANVVGNDKDVDNWPVGKADSFGLTVASVTAVGGTASIWGTKDIKFTPTANLNNDNNPGGFSVTYKVRDPEGNVSDNEVTIPIQVTPKNKKPQAGGGGGSGNEDTQIAISLPNDTGGEGDEYANQVLEYVLVTPPTNGSVDLVAMVYTPNADYFGSDSFEYKVKDDDRAGDTAGLLSDSAFASIGIAPVNDAPWAEGSSGSCDEDTSATISINYGDIDNDLSTLVVTVDSPYASASGGVITYTPPADWFGEDSFSYTVTDPDGAVATGSITVTVNPVNDAPIAHDMPDEQILVGITSGSVSYFYTDIDGPALAPGSEMTITWTDPAKGWLEHEGYYSAWMYHAFTPETTWTHGETDTWEYTVSDGEFSSTATVTVTWIWTDYGLLTASGLPQGPAGDLLAEALAPIIAEAQARWAATGVNVSALDAIDFFVADLPGATLGLAGQGHIVIDTDAAGHGWFVDATPGNDREFNGKGVAKRNSDAFGDMDLLTVVMHEMGHVLGLEHSHDGVMDHELEAGVRRNPDFDDVSLMLAVEQVGKKRHRLGVDHFFAEIGGGR